MGLKAEQRHEYIISLLNTNGRIEVADIAQHLNVTEVTVRRDLAKMQRQGILKKTYGGAVLTKPDFNFPVRYRQSKNINAKKMIGKLAASLIDNGDIIYLEAGSTCFEIIPFLADKRDLTIITNSFYLMSRLHELATHKVMVIGGQYRPERMDMVGPASEMAISQLSGFKAFTGGDDISADSGISGADVVTVSFAKLVIQQASKVIFVGDKTKFDRPALYKFADIDQIDHIVTDKKPNENWLKICGQKDIKLLYPEDEK